ncbi:MAG: hypothetical protein P8101_04960 [Candidatus Thiodiazotropha sp.]
MNGSAVIEALGELIETCLNDGGSDIHLTADFHPMLRLHGRLEPQKWLRFSAVEISALADGMLNERQQEQYRSTGQVDFGYTDGQGLPPPRSCVCLLRYRPCPNSKMGWCW